MIDDEPLAPLGYRLGGIWSTTAFVGRGPVGEVYECSRPEVPERLVAKLLPEELLESSEIWSSYLAAVSAAGALPTEATVRHVAFGSDLQLACPFVVTERVTWPSLASRIAQDGPIAPKLWGKTLGGLISLFERAHSAGVAHGRLTPTNLFVSRDAPAKLKVTDFGVGIACAARAGETLGGGVAGWVAPENAAPNAQPSSAGDIYGLGLLTFFALTGKPLFCAVDAKEVDHERLRSEMSVPLRAASEVARKLGADLDPAFDKWFARTVVPTPDGRYSSVKLLGEAFEHVLRRMNAGPLTAPAPAPSAKAATTPPRPAASIAKSPSAAASFSPRAKPPASVDEDPLDEQPTIRLSLETLLARKQQGAEPRIEPATVTPAPAPVVAPPVTAIAEAVPPPPPLLWAAPADPPMPVVEAQPTVLESAPVPVASAEAPSSATVDVPAPAAREAGAKAPLLGRPLVMGILALGLVLFGILVGLGLGSRPPEAEPAAAPQQAQADVAKPEEPAAAPIRTPPPTAAEIPTPTPSAEAPPVAVASAPVASSALAPAPDTPPPSAAAPPPVATTPRPVAPGTAQPQVPTARTSKPPTPVATDAAPKPKSSTTKPTSAAAPAPAPARKKPCGTFINPCK